MISADNLCSMILDSAESFCSFLQQYGILVHAAEMTGKVQGFVYISLKGEYHIVINEYLSPSTKLKILLHELKHIFEDLQDLGFVVGLDFQNITFEDEADKFAEKIIDKLKNNIAEGGNSLIG